MTDVVLMKPLDSGLGLGPLLVPLLVLAGGGAGGAGGGGAGGSGGGADVVVVVISLFGRLKRASE